MCQVSTSCSLWTGCEAAGRVEGVVKGGVGAGCADVLELVHKGHMQRLHWGAGRLSRSTRGATWRPDEHRRIFNEICARFKFKFEKSNKNKLLFK